MGEKMGNDTSSECFYCFSGPVCEHKQHLPINIDIFFFFFQQNHYSCTLISWIYTVDEV